VNARFRLREILRLVTVAVLLLMGGCLEQDGRLLDPAAAVEIMRQNKDNPAFIILDVRTEQEFRQGHLEGAVLLDYYAPNFRDRFAELDRDALIFMYCRSGNRSSHVLKMADKLGFKTVYDLRGGILAWKSQGLPLVMDSK
jgi:rhodanese-related sulfurtransferase